MLTCQEQVCDATLCANLKMDTFGICLVVSRRQCLRARVETFKVGCPRIASILLRCYNCSAKCPKEGAVATYRAFAPCAAQMLTINELPGIASQTAPTAPTSGEFRQAESLTHASRWKFTGCLHSGRGSSHGGAPRSRDIAPSGHLWQIVAMHAILGSSSSSQYRPAGSQEGCC